MYNGHNIHKANDYSKSKSVIQEYACQIQLDEQKSNIK